MLHHNNQKGRGMRGDLFKIFRSTISDPAIYKGELHIGQILPDGSVRKGDFIGPRTNILERMDQKGITLVDEISKEHDLAYLLAGMELDKKKRAEKVKEADKKMLSRLKKAKAKKLDKKANIFVGELGIKGKNVLEKHGSKIGRAVAGPVGELAGKLLERKLLALADPTSYTQAEYQRAIEGKKATSDNLDMRGVGYSLRKKYLKN